MCGRMEIHTAVELIATIFGVNPEDVLIDYKPDYNVAPTHAVPIVVAEGKRRLVSCRWGFIPSWAKDEKTGYSMINARAETVAEKPAYRHAFRKQRCLVVADGFYEWEKTDKGKKPVHIHLKSGKPMGLAGLYNIWTSPKGEKINTCTIIVTDADDLVAPIHNRMPVIVGPDDQGKWLDPAIEDPAALVPILRPYPSDDLDLYEVSAKVNSVKNNDPDLIKPVIEKLF